MPNFTYTTGRPAGNLTPAQNRPSMQTNNDSINSILDVDLIGFNDNDGGFHQKTTYVVQGSDPGSTSAQVVEYSKAVSASSELFIQRDAVATPIQMTSGTTVSSTNGQSFLPGGLQIKWGTASINGSGTVTYTSVGLTAFPTNTLAVVLTAQSNARTYNWGSPTATGFAISASASGAASVTWIAIGN